MAITITEQNWLALQAATRMAADLTTLMEQIRDNRTTEQNVKASLKSIGEKAEFVRQFCAAAEARA